MDIFGILNIPNWIIVLAVMIYVCYLYLARKYGAFESLGVPGPKPLPIVGNILQDFFSVVHDKDMENKKKYGRLFCFYEGTQPTLRVSDPAILREVLAKQFNNFTDRRHFNSASLQPIMTKMMQRLRGEIWKMTRDVMTPTFTSVKLKQMVPLIEKCSQKFMDKLGKKVDAGESLDAKEIYISFLLEIVGSCAFGVEINDTTNSNNKFIYHARRLAYDRRMITFFLSVILPRKLASKLNITIVADDDLNYIDEMLRNVIKVRESRNERRNDFLQIMLDALKDADTKALHDEKTDSETKEIEDIKAVLTPDGVLAQCVVFLAAGFDATSTTLSYISYTAATNPECQDKLIDEVDRVLQDNEGKINWDTIAQMTYMDMFILETLRLYPATIRYDRHCIRDTQIGDLHIPKGTLVNILVYAIHHDEEFYPDPYKFDPERFTTEKKAQRNLYTYLAFGTGPRNCIGMRFGLMVIKLTLVHILKNFRFCRALKTKEPLVFEQGCMQLRPAGGIHVMLARR